MRYAVFSALFLLLSSTAFAEIKQPKLLVVLVVDQFRADYLTRFKSNFLPAKDKSGKLGGLNYLMENGAYFPFAQHDIAQCMTAPGHASILTGAYPYSSGIPLNDWYDRDKETFTRSVSDPDSPIVGQAAPVGNDGFSPRNLIANTVGDELKNAGFGSRVVSVSLKAPPAVLLGGHRADIALWYDPKPNQWVSSKHYLPDGHLPAWVTKINLGLSKKERQRVNWKSGNMKTGFSESTLENESTPNTQFEYNFKVGSPEINGTPYGLEITRIAAEEALTAYQLGRKKSTDLLAVSFSSHDVAGHLHGPNSREMEEMTYALDREIGHLLNTIKKSLPGGLNEVVIVFTGDHGVAPVPEWASARKYEAGIVDEDELVMKVSSHLDQKYGKPAKGKWVSVLMSFNLYLNRNTLKEKQLKLSDVEAEVKFALKQDHRISYIITSDEIEKRILPPGMHEKQILRSFYPARSGDLMLLFKPYYIPKGLDASPANHISGYSYDRTVPLIFSGSRIRPKVHSARADVVDIAPTLAFLAGVLPPSLSEGKVLTDIID